MLLDFDTAIHTDRSCQVMKRKAKLLKRNRFDRLAFAFPFLGARGGNVLFPSVPVNAITGEDLPPARQLAPALGLAERPRGPARWNYITGRELYCAILQRQPYAVRGLLGFGANL